MRRFGKLVMALGAGVGALVALAIGAHLGATNVPWLVNVALAKLGLVASVALMAGGAASIRIANRREQRRLTSPSEHHAS
jgi:hypothetical protein